MNNDITPVIFRKFRNGEVIAIFPTLPGTYDPGTCMSYLRVGQHGAVHLPLITQTTRPALKAEYADLKAELEQEVGYTLKVCKRVTYKLTQERFSNLR